MLQTCVLRAPWRLGAWLGLVVAATACEGFIDDPVSGGGNTNVPTNPGVAPTQAALDVGLRRLETDQIVNTLRSRFERVGGDPNRIRSVIDNYRTNPLHRDAKSAALRAEEAAPFSDLAPLVFAVSQQMLLARGGTDALFGSCGSDAEADNDAECLRGFFRNHGPHFWRRPVASDEVESFIAPFLENGPLDRGTLRRFLSAVMLSPEFLLVVEHGQEGTDDDDEAPLTAYELAARLSYFLWRDAPDEELLEAAETGALLQPDEMERQAQRLLEDRRSVEFFKALVVRWMHVDSVRLDYSRIFNSKRFRYSVDRLFQRDSDRTLITRQRLDGEGNPELDAQGNPVLEFVPFYTSLESYNYVRQPSALPDPIIQEAAEFLRHIVVDRTGTLEDIFVTEVALTPDPRLAEIYGVPVWDGVSEPPTTPTGRGGILGRIAVVGTADSSTRPILRGVHIWKDTLCRDLAEPPDDVVFTPPPDGPFTTRGLVEYSTREPSCAQCHSRLNDFAFALEGLDSLGQMRTQEPFFASDDNPDRLGNLALTNRIEESWLPLDTSANVFLALDTRTPVNGALELAQAIAAYRAPQISVLHEAGFDGDAYRCLAQNLLAFGLDGAVAERDDALAVESSVRGGPVRDAVLALVGSESFRKRVFREREGDR